MAEEKKKPARKKKSTKPLEVKEADIAKVSIEKVVEPIQESAVGNPKECETCKYDYGHRQCKPCIVFKK